MYKTIIVEDDLMVCAILEKQLGRFSQLQLCGNFRRCSDALAYLTEDPEGAQLVVLDYYMPGMNGIEFLAELRKTNIDVQVIMITSAGDYSVIRSAMCHGICDYVLKPFNSARLEKAIVRFETTMRLIKTTHVWTQDKVDTLLSPHKHYNVEPVNESGVPSPGKINKTTLENVRAYMRLNAGKKMPLVEISEGLTLSTVTSRRYLKYMNSLGEINITLDCKTGGRPSEIFEYIGEDI
ncbi:MAG: response regulator [Oscillospiraceae bacterium]|nr:response regulator [Oscillospiraceae bacterium]